MAKKRILYVFPTAWDARQLAACRPAWEPTYAVLFAEPSDEDTPANLDVLGWIERTAEEHRGRIDGVTSSSDYPGAMVAAAIAARLGLAGPRPLDVIRCAHKYHARLAQREAAPEAVPWFQALRATDPRGPDQRLEFPCFVKPVKGSFSQHARRIGSSEELTAFLERPAIEDFCQGYLAIFNTLVRAYTPFEEDGHWFLAEGLLEGDQVTVEGYTQGGKVEILGVVDSVLHPGTRSFARFDLPSRHPPELVERMAELARRVMRGMGLEGSLFNMELVIDPSQERLSILEINPRISGQFGDLHGKVSGINTFEIQLALAAGERPTRPRGRGPFAMASSYPLRTFEPARVVRAPDEREVAALQARHPGLLVWVECESGALLADPDGLEDGASVRYAVVNLGAASPAELEDRLAAVRKQLGFVLTTS